LHASSDQQAGLTELGLRLAEAKQLTAAIQAEIVPAQVTIVGVCHRSCATCGHVLVSKGHYTATFRSLFGDVPVRGRRLLACPCQGSGRAKVFAVLDLEAATVAPELAYLTARYAALAPFGKVAALLSESLPSKGAQNAGAVRNRTLRVGEAVVQPHFTCRAQQIAPQQAESVVVGLDGGYVRSRHRHEERHFEVVAGKVIDADGNQSRFAFARNRPTIASDVFKQALAVAGVQANTPATVLCDGDDGGHGRAQLVARRGALRARSAGGSRPWRGLHRHAPGRRGGSRSGACEVALVAWALAGTSVQARVLVSLEVAHACAGCGWYRASPVARQ
jgi:hypothetical protein